MIGLAFTMICGLFTVYTLINRQIDALQKELAARFTLADQAREGARNEAMRLNENLRADVVDRSHDLRALVHTEVGALHVRIDEVKTEYARREDFQNLTSSLNALNSRIDGLLSGLLAKMVPAE